MIDIYICDDDSYIRNEIQNMIEKKILIGEYDMRIIACCGTPSQLLTALRQSRQRRNLYFLDVELKDELYDGFLLGKEIRKTDPNGTIIYITSFGDLAYKTFRYHIEAYDYIVKGKPQELADNISRCLASLKEKMEDGNADSTEYFTFKAGGLVKHVPVDDIYFFETSHKPHHVILHGKRQRIEFLGSLNEIEKKLDERFIKIHRSYLIAAEKIEEIDLRKNYVVVGGSRCSVSRKEKKALLDRMNQR